MVVAVRGESEWVDVTIHWAGGSSSSHELVRPVQRYQQMVDYRRLLNRIDELRKAGQTLAEVAKQLNREGFHPPKRSATFTSVILSGLLAKRGRTGPRPRVVAEPGVLMGPEESNARNSEPMFLNPLPHLLTRPCPFERMGVQPIVLRPGCLT